MKPDDELEDLIRTERAANPPAGTAERTWRRLDASLATGAALASNSSASADLGASGEAVLKLSRGGWLVSKLSLVLASTAIATGVGIGALLLSHRATLPNAAAAASSSGFEAPALVEDSPANLTGPIASSVGGMPASPTHAPPLAHRSTGRDSDEAFERELSLVRRVKASLDAAHPDEALGLLDQHAREFSHGVFAKERDMLRFVILCQRGASETTRSRARAFVEANPTSLSVDRVRRACGL